MRGTRGTETSQYPEEKKVKTIPKVVASEIGGAQTAGSNTRGVRTPGRRRLDSGTHLERWTKEGKSPVHEREDWTAGTGVRRDTRNPDGRKEDHLQRLNTTM